MGRCAQIDVQYDSVLKLMYNMVVYDYFIRLLDVHITCILRITPSNAPLHLHLCLPRRCSIVLILRGKREAEELRVFAAASASFHRGAADCHPGSNLLRAPDISREGGMEGQDVNLHGMT